MYGLGIGGVEVGDAGVGTAEGIIEGNREHGAILDGLQAAGDFSFPGRGKGVSPLFLNL